VNELRFLERVIEAQPDLEKRREGMEWMKQQIYSKPDVRRCFRTRMRTDISSSDSGAGASWQGVHQRGLIDSITLFLDSRHEPENGS